MKTTLITGAASGLGKEFAKIYAREGNNLILVDIDLEGLKKVKRDLLAIYNIKCDIINVDLSNKEDLEKVYKYTVDADYFVNNLVNCAGFGDRCDFKEMDIELQMKMTDVDCNALLYFTHKYVCEMIKQDEGHIINISSIAGFLPGPFMSTYHACKGFVLLLGEALSYELKGTNVKLLTLCPGPFNSNFVSKAKNYYTFSKIKPVDAKYVAEFGYKKSIKGKSLAIVGLKNRLTIFLTRFAPRSFVTKSSAKTMKSE